MDLVMDNTYKYRKIIDALNKIKHWADFHPSMEICGFLGFNIDEKKYVVQLEQNCSADPQNFFAIDALRYLFFKQKNSIVAIFHSHITGDESASEFDIKMSENCCVPFLIYSLNTKKIQIYQPKNSEYDVKILERVKERL
jgi:proteasome lid subunit RPN8/RPN11